MSDDNFLTYGLLIENFDVHEFIYNNVNVKMVEDLIEGNINSYVILMEHILSYIEKHLNTIIYYKEIKVYIKYIDIENYDQLDNNLLKKIVHINRKLMNNPRYEIYYENLLKINTNIVQIKSKEIILPDTNLNNSRYNLADALNDLYMDIKPNINNLNILEIMNKYDTNKKLLKNIKELNSELHKNILLKLVDYVDKYVYILNIYETEAYLNIFDVYTIRILSGDTQKCIDVINSNLYYKCTQPLHREQLILDIVHTYILPLDDLIDGICDSIIKNEDVIYTCFFRGFLVQLRLEDLVTTEINCKLWIIMYHYYDIIKKGIGFDLVHHILTNTPTKDGSIIIRKCIVNEIGNNLLWNDTKINNIRALLILHLMLNNYSIESIRSYAKKYGELKDIRTIATYCGFTRLASIL